MMPRLTRRAAILGGAALLPCPFVHPARAAEAVSYLFPAPSFLPAFVPFHLAQSRGYFTAENVAVTFSTGRGGADTAKQVAVGNADLGGGVGETAMIVRANGLPVRGTALLGGKPLFQLATRKAAGIKGLADLRGRKIGVIGYQDTSFYTLLGVLAGEGMKKADVQIQALGPAGMTQLMGTGSVDGIMAVPEWVVEIEEAGTPLDIYPIEKMFPAMAQAILASDTTVQKRPQAVGGVCRAVVKAVQSCIDDPKAASRDFVAAVPQQAGKEAEVERIVRRYATEVYATPSQAVLGRFDPARLKTVEDFYVDNKLIQTATPVSELYTNALLG